MDNGVKVTSSIVPIGSEIMPRMGNAYASVATPSTTQYYNLVASDGSRVSHQVWNDASDDTKMDVAIVVTANGSTQTFTPRVPSGQKANVNISSGDGSILTGRVTTTITAVRANSVPYTYILNQLW